MRKILQISMVVLAVTFVMSAVSVADSGADLFKSKCAACHGATGAGDTAMGKNLKLRDLGAADVQAMSDSDLNGVITNGKGKMPKYDGKLTKEQIDDLVKYIRTLKK
jgi:cytochrome c6